MTDYRETSVTYSLHVLDKKRHDEIGLFFFLKNVFEKPLSVFITLWSDAVKPWRP